MGEVHVEFVVVNPRTGARSGEITALADTAATLTVIPGEVLRRLGIQTIRTVSLVLADGRRARRHVGEAAVAVNGESVPCHVVFGESGDTVLLGLTVLEKAGFAVDPVQRRLVPREFLLY
jgi:clan AA aspartic protease